MPVLFRNNPPKELCEKLVIPFGLSSLQDTNWFSKTTLRLSDFEVFLPEVEPYYMPCKAKELLHTTPLTHHRAFTILRQVLKTQNIELHSKEQTCGGVKGTWYQLQPKTFSIAIDFS